MSNSLIVSDEYKRGYAAGLEKGQHDGLYLRTKGAEELATFTEKISDQLHIISEFFTCFYTHDDEGLRKAIGRMSRLNRRGKSS
jgi:hypothetical protein